MQDVDFLKQTEINSRISILWILPLVLLLVIYIALVSSDYKKVLELKAQWSALPKINDTIGEVSLAVKQSANKNAELYQLFNYFAHIENETVTVSVIDLNQSLVLKASGEALDIESISVLVSAMAEHPLFEKYSDYRLSVNQLSLKEDEILWSIEWLQ